MNNKPYFESENKEFILYLGDSFELLKEIESKSVDVVVTDPPYFLSSGGISCHSGKQVIVDKGDWDKVVSIEEKIEFNRKWIRLAKEVLKDDGTIFISGTLHNIYSIGVALELEGFSIINNITWEKSNPAPNIGCRSFAHSTETILWARKVLSSKKKGNYYFNYDLMKELNEGKQMKDVWRLNTVPKSETKFGKHPTQKPLSLIKRILLAASKEKDLILDPFLGSGTTGISAYLLNRRFVGIEKEKEYLDISINRFKEAKRNE